MNTAVNLGIKIKNMRELCGFTQSNIAKYLKVDQSQISKVEKGERTLTSDMLDKLAALFGVQISAFNGGNTTEKPLTFALCAREISDADLETISAINRIALNCNFMTRLLEGGHSNG